MNDSVFERLLETARRRELTADERAELAASTAQDPAGREAWLEEAALSRVLGALPPAVLPPGFPARVVAAVESSERAASSEVLPWRARLRAAAWRWRIAGAVAAVAVAVLAVQFQQRAAERARLAESVAALSALADLPGFDALADFDLVYSLPAGPLPDAQELARALE
jgi:anti-sigma factor RsiW